MLSCGRPGTGPFGAGRAEGLQSSPLVLVGALGVRSGRSAGRRSRHQSGELHLASCRDRCGPRRWLRALTWMHRRRTTDWWPSGLVACQSWPAGWGCAAGLRDGLSRRRRRTVVDVDLHTVRVDTRHGGAEERRGFVSGGARRLAVLPAARPRAYRRTLKLAYGVQELALYDPMIPSAYYSSWRAVSRESPGTADDSVYCPGIEHSRAGPALRRLVRAGASRDCRDLGAVSSTRRWETRISIGSLMRLRATLTPLAVRRERLPADNAPGTPVEVTHPDPASWKLHPTPTAHRSCVFASPTFPDGTPPSTADRFRSSTSPG